MTADHRSAMAQARARGALAKAGLESQVELEPLPSVTNEVWAADDVIVRVNPRPVPRLWREATLDAMLPDAVGCPRVLGYGGIGGADWMVTERLPGEILSRCWPTMPVDDRRNAIRQLSARLRHLHGFISREPLPPLSGPQLLDTATMAASTAALLHALDQLQELPHVDPVVALQAKMLVRYNEPALDHYPASGVIHGDLHFENVLWDGATVTGLLDFEYARPAPADLELDVFLRFCAYPFLHVAEDYEDQANAADYTEVPGWLSVEMPELFSAPRFLDRLRIYSVAYDVRDLLDEPPDRPVDELHHLHAWHRLVETVEGRGHLDRLSLPATDGADRHAPSVIRDLDGV
jgi:hygromycin-B 7''-O-kinase